MIETLAIVIVSIWLHELGHALASKLTGDRLGSRRWSWRPLVNLDPIFSFAIPLLSCLLSGGVFAAGVGRPFLLERLNWRIAIAGPLVNLLVFAVAAVLGYWHVASLNLGLAIFNMLPLKPLDGHHLMTALRYPKLAA